MKWTHSRILFSSQKYDIKNKIEKEDPVTFIDVYTEFNEKISEKYKITKFKSRVSQSSNIDVGCTRNNPVYTWK